MVKATFGDLKLAMWEKVVLNEREKNEKGEWVNTGLKVEKTEYKFRDEFGDVLTLLGTNDYRELESRQVEITVGIRQSDYGGKRNTTLTLESCHPAD